MLRLDDAGKRRWLECHLSTLGAGGCLVRPSTAIAPSNPPPIQAVRHLSVHKLSHPQSIPTLNTNPNICSTTPDTSMLLQHKRMHKTAKRDFETLAALTFDIARLLATTPPLEGRHPSPNPPPARPPRRSAGSLLERTPLASTHRTSQHMLLRAAIPPIISKGRQLLQLS
jgi:hypothetical protein